MAKFNRKLGAASASLDEANARLDDLERIGE